MMEARLVTGSTASMLGVDGEKERRLMADQRDLGRRRWVAMNSLMTVMTTARTTGDNESRERCVDGEKKTGCEVLCDCVYSPVCGCTARGRKSDSYGAF